MCSGGHRALVEAVASFHSQGKQRAALLGFVCGTRLPRRELEKRCWRTAPLPRSTAERWRASMRPSPSSSQGRFVLISVSLPAAGAGDGNGRGSGRRRFSRSCPSSSLRHSLAFWPLLGRPAWCRQLSPSTTAVAVLTQILCRSHPMDRHV